MKLKVADLIVEINILGELLLSRVQPYVYDGEKAADIVIEIPKRYYENKHKEFPHLSFEECEYLWSGSSFYEQLVDFDGLMLHSSCVEYEGKAYLFSARSGTGKSTHTHLWLEYLNGARIINDDKPAIRCIDGEFYAYGTPWSGKTDESENVGVPIAGISFLERGENEIKRIPGIMALKLFMEQTVRSVKKDTMEKTLDLLGKILTEIPIYRLSCDMTEAAVKTSYNGMKV